MQRKTVTVLFCDVVGSTALGESVDPESLRAVLCRYFERMKSIVERHGGTVERSSGETAVGFFGLATTHEDDVLRALRAALELQVTAGVDTGELFVGEEFASGQPLSRARRLFEAAPRDAILLSPDVHRLVEPVAVAQPSGDAWQLVGLRPEESDRPHAGPFVGRDAELEALRTAFEQARTEPGCRMVTVVGPAGIGKSRLARELVTSIGDDATVVVGRCVSYGVGITYGPVAEIVRQLGGTPRVAELLSDDPQAAQRVLGAIGESEEPGQPEEIFWGFRRLLEEAARAQPLVVAVEDVHWAEPTLLDLLDYLAAFSRELPILLVCLARPELLEARPEWTAPQAGRSVHVLAPLGAGDAQELARALGAEAQTAQIVDTAEGNPLFLEQLVAVGEEGEALPPTIHAVLAARIDRLEPAERALLLRASVEGRTFHAGALRELLPEAERATMSQQLVGLVRKQLIRVDRPQLPGEDAFRFSHALVREAAYEGLSKQVRAELHERLGRWLDERPETPEEIVAYNLEQAHLLRAALGTATPELGEEAAARLESAARAALARGDARAGAALLERAVALADDPSLLPRLGAALFGAGRLADADPVLARAIEQADRSGDEHMVALALVERELVRLETEPSGEVEAAAEVATAALEVLERHDDEHGQSRAWSLRAAIAWLSGRIADADEAWDQAARHARSAGDDRELFEILGWQASGSVFGPTPVRDAIKRCTKTRRQVSGSPLAVGLTLHPLGALHAMRGDFDQARELIAEGNAILGELGRMQSAVSHHEAIVEMLAGRPEVAEAQLRVGYDELTRVGGDGATLATTAAMLAEAVYEQERLDEAAELCELAARTAPPEDLVTQVMWRGVQGKVLARREQLDEGAALAREAVALVEQTDMLYHHGQALLDLATVLRLGGQTADAEAALDAGYALHERKGNTAATQRVKRMEVS